MQAQPRATRQVFDFLEKEYRFRAHPVVWVDPWGREPQMYMPYKRVSIDVGVAIKWGIASATLSIWMSPWGSKYELEWLRVSSGGAYLDNVAMFRSGGKAELPFGDPWRRESTPEMLRRMKKQMERLDRDPLSVLEEYARLLREYAADILEGDVSVFPAVQAYCKEKYSEWRRATGPASHGPAGGDALHP